MVCLFFWPLTLLVCHASSMNLDDFIPWYLVSHFLAPSLICFFWFVLYLNITSVLCKSVHAYCLKCGTCQTWVWVFARWIWPAGIGSCRSWADRAGPAYTNTPVGEKSHSGIKLPGTWLHHLWAVRSQASYLTSAFIKWSLPTWWE